MTATRKGRSRKAPLCAPSSPAVRGDVAQQIMRALIETGDYLGSNPYSPIHKRRSHFLLVEVDDALFLRLCQQGAATEDMEPSDDDEPSIGAAGMDSAH